MEYFLQIYSLVLDIILDSLSDSKVYIFWSQQTFSKKQHFTTLLKSYKKLEKQIIEFNKIFDLRMSIEVWNCVMASIFGGYFGLGTILQTESWTFETCVTTFSSVLAIFCTIYFLFRICLISSEISAKGREIVVNLGNFLHVETFYFGDSPTKVLKLLKSFSNLNCTKFSLVLTLLLMRLIAAAISITNGEQPFEHW